MIKIKLNKLPIIDYNKYKIDYPYNNHLDIMIKHIVRFLYLNKMLYESSEILIFPEKIMIFNDTKNIDEMIANYTIADFHYDEEYLYYFDNNIDKYNFIRKQKIDNLLK